MNARQQDFAYKVRHALNDNLDNLPATTTTRLGAARALALSRKKQEPGVRARAVHLISAHGDAGFFSDPLAWFGRIGLAIPFIVLVIGIVAIYQAEEEYQIIEIADIDAAVLSDELPLSAYLDRGFNAYLAKRLD